MIRLTWGNEKYLSQVLTFKKSERKAIVLIKYVLQINATLLFVVGRFPNLKVNWEKLLKKKNIWRTKYLKVQWKYFQVQWKLEQEGRKWVHSSFLETNNFGFWSRYQDILQGDFFEDYFLLAYKSLTWMLWSKTKCGKVDSLATMIFQFLRFHGLWKPTTTWSTISGNLELLLKLWNSRGDDNQVGFDHQSPLRNTITCSTKTERVIRTKSGGRIDKWASFP